MELNLWSWNVNGLRAVLNKDFIATVQREKPDWLGLEVTHEDRYFNSKLVTHPFSRR